MTARRGIQLLMIGLAAVALSGCRKPPPPKAVVALPTPTPSPDSDAIVFERRGQLWMMKWDGSGAGVLASSRKASFWFPSASPKGDDVLAWMSRPDGSEDVVRVFLDGRFETLTSMGEPATSPMKNIRLGNAASYDSKAERIAYSYNGNIWLMDRDGYNAQTLISDGLSYSPVWSPDDKKIAYVNGKNSHYDLWVTDVTSHDTWQVTDFQDYSVGQPLWSADGKRLMLTRTQQDDSDIVSVLADTDVPLVDSDAITKDKSSAAATLNKEGKYLAFSSAGPPDPKASADAPAPIWDIWTADAAGKETKKITTDGGSSPTWIRPSVPSSVMAMPMTTLPPSPVPTATRPPLFAARPTPAANPTAVMASSAAPRPMNASGPSNAAPGSQAPNSNTSAQAPMPMQARVQVQPQASASNAPGQGMLAQGNAVKASPAPNMSQASSAPMPTARPTAVRMASAALSEKPAPTQPPTKAPPLRLRLRVRFDPDTDQLVLSSLTELKKTASRVHQYADENITVFGPLDRSPLRGTYSSEDDRSQARAEQVAAQLSKASHIPMASISSQPYAPFVIGAQAANGIQINVELK